jgi:Rps23 Pro-64 3,4-dihydroxylase Tpa1-like proline 4-hydroxylase
MVDVTDVADLKPAEASSDQDLFFFSRSEMLAMGERLHEAFKSAAPFPHIVIDDFLPAEVAQRIAGSFPGIEDIPWRFEGPGDSKHSGSKYAEKVSTSDEELFPPYVRHMMAQFQSGIFCRFLDKLTGYTQLQPDPNHFGCGLHSTGVGGRLMLHIDASRHPNRDLHQLVNCIYYCSPDWRSDWGGDLELWNADATECVRKVEPRFNRLVVFYTGGKSWHGHPHPVRAPEGRRRNSLALYYYTTDKSLSDIEYTSFVKWKGVTEHDRKKPLHHVKAFIRAVLPTAAVNQVAKLARKAKLNSKY